MTQPTYWREPGQAVPEVFRKSPALRYTAEGGAIIGRNLGCFNNRPLYGAPGADGVTEELELVPPMNFWSLAPWGGLDYSYETNAFALPRTPPPTVQLGTNCRAMVLSWRLRPDVTLESITLETLSQDVVIGLMGVSVERAITSAPPAPNPNRERGSL